MVIIQNYFNRVYTLFNRILMTPDSCFDKQNVRGGLKPRKLNKITRVACLANYAERQRPAKNRSKVDRP